MSSWCPEEEIQTVLDEISDKLKMTATYVDPNGKILLKGGEYNPLCALIRAKEDALKFICSLTSQRMLKEVKKTGKPFIDYCELGLLRFVIPVFQDGELIGAIAACGTLDPAETVEIFFVAKQLDIEEEEAKDLTETVTVADPDEVKILVDKIANWVNQKT